MGMAFPSFGAHLEERLDFPRPFLSGLSLAACGVLPLIAGVTGLIRPLSALVFAAIFAAVGALQASFAYYELAGLRRLADRELRIGKRPYFRPALVSWRSAELISDRHRRALARAVARTERDLSPATLPGSSPLNRIAARPYVDLFRKLAERIADLDRPVDPRGVLLVGDLLTAAGSPLYARERATDMRASLCACLDALDAEPLSAELPPVSRQRGIPARGKRKRGLAVMTKGHRLASLTLGQSRLRKGK
jgi:hypothetical protein